MKIMPFFIVGFHRKVTVIILTGDGDLGHVRVVIMNQWVTTGPDTGA